MTGTLSETGNAREFTLGVIQPNPLGVSRDIVCTFTNTSLVAPVTITKTVVDAFGQNPLPGVGWSVAAAATATSGTVTQTPAASQTTNAQGAASWGVRFGTAESVATVNVSETQQSDYLFSSGTCTITPPTGDAAHCHADRGCRYPHHRRPPWGERRLRLHEQAQADVPDPREVGQQPLRRPGRSRRVGHSVPPAVRRCPARLERPP